MRSLARSIVVLALVASTAAAEQPPKVEAAMFSTYMSARSWARLGDEGRPVLAFVSGTERRSLFDKRLNITVLANTRPVVESAERGYPELVGVLDKSVPFGGYLLALCDLGYHVVVSDGSAQGLPFASAPARLIIVDDSWSASLPLDWRDVIARQARRARVQVWSAEGRIQTIQSEGPRSAGEPPRARIRVTAAGAVLLDSKRVTVEELDRALTRLATRRGVAVYLRDSPNGEPPAVASKVIAEIMKHKLPIAFAIDEDELDAD